MISIHALREEGDPKWLHLAAHAKISIHALREEGDPRRPARSPSSCNFYPRPPRGGRPSGFNTFLRAICISIHALREEGDQKSTGSIGTERKFLSTPSARRATKDAPADSVELADFYPRPPRGGRLRKRILSPSWGEFLSTPSARRATLTAVDILHRCGNFYPRPPRGGRP